MKKHISILLLIVGVVACDQDVLEVDPQGSVFASTYFVTAEQIEEAVIATYDVLGHQKGVGLAWSPYLVISEILSDDAYAGGQDAGDGAEENEFNTFNISTGNEVVQSIWKRNYTGIYRANFTIEKSVLSTRITEEERAQFLSEAKFLRAYFYYELVRFFENVPLLTYVPTSIEDGKKPQASPVDIYNQIATDLVESIEGLPDSWGSQTGRATKWAAKALLARAYLFEKGVYGNGLIVNDTALTDADILAELEDIITNSGHALASDYGSIFRVAGEYGEENVFEVSYAGEPVGGDWGTEQYVEGNLAAQMMGPRVTNSDTYYRGWSFAIPTQKLYDDMTGDPRRQYTILTQDDLLAEAGTSLNTGAFQHTGFYNWKYTTLIVDRGTVGTPELHNMTNYRAIRYSDVLLMAAELGENVNYLNDVRLRVGLAPLSVYSADALFNERRMEFAGEGLRYWDLLRRGQTVAAQELSMNEVGVYYTDDPVVYEVTYNDATAGFLPIPQVEIDLFGGILKQNDGY